MMESAKYTIKEAVQAIQELHFDEDTCKINQYVKKRLQNNDIFEIINMERQDISSAVYHMLQNSQPTSLKFSVRYFIGCVSHASKFSALVEGSFSML